jgi:hypothetical protein
MNDPSKIWVGRCPACDKPHFLAPCPPSAPVQLDLTFGRGVSEIMMIREKYLSGFDVFGWGRSGRTLNEVIAAVATGPLAEAVVRMRDGSLVVVKRKPPRTLSPKAAALTLGLMTREEHRGRR